MTEKEKKVGGHESYERANEFEGSSNRAFGLVFVGFFTIVGIVPWAFGGKLHLWALVLALGLLVVSLLLPSLLAPFNRAWLKFGLLLHKIVSPVVLGIMFFLVVTPIGLLMRMFGKDPLRLKFEPSADSYWIDRSPPGPPPESLKDQF